jgi:hypothetical protein
MNAQLLAQLRLANFPQRDPQAVLTCAELIHACGESIETIVWERPSAEWTAHSRDGAFYHGQALEDALANLWLATRRQFNREAMSRNETKSQRSKPYLNRGSLTASIRGSRITAARCEDCANIIVQRIADTLSGFCYVTCSRQLYERATA